MPTQTAKTGLTLNTNMPLTDFSPTEIEWMKAQGIDPETATLAPTTTNAPTQMSDVGAAKATLEGHAGSLVGGGLAGLGGWAAGASLAGYLGAPETGGASLILPLIASLGAGAVGSAAGEKGQEAVLPKDLEDQLQAKAQEAQQTHPLVSAGTDIAASALTSGGRFSPGTTVKGLRDLVGGQLSNEAKAVLLQGGLNPAISAGMSEAQGQGLPSATELGEQAVGGALFAAPSRLGDKFNRPKGEVPPPIDPPQEPNTTVDLPSSGADAPTSPWLARGADGNYSIDNGGVATAIKKAFPKPTTQGDPSDPAFLQQMTQWRQQTRQPMDDLRQTLHQRYVDQLGSSVEPVAEPLAKQDNTVVPKVTTEQILPQPIQCQQPILIYLLLKVLPRRLLR